MMQHKNIIAAYSIMILLIIAVGVLQSWTIALTILNYCLISAVMTIGANIQWGYAGLINFGIMGYTALGGLAAVLVNVPPVKACLLYTTPSPRDRTRSRMPSSA